MNSSSRANPVSEGLVAPTSGAEPAGAFTPGPWQNGIEDLEGVVAPDNPGLGNVICLPPRKNMYSSLDRWPANARLIAAAPDLLAACIALQMEARARNCGLRIADEAIAKALGAPAAEGSEPGRVA